MVFSDWRLLATSSTAATKQKKERRRMMSPKFLTLERISQNINRHLYYHQLSSA
jgi:hypothetical protein